MILRNRLKERRAALNVNQQEMGRLCGVSRQTISLIERGDYSPSVTLALTIAKVCGVTVEDIFYLQEEIENENDEIKQANRKALPKFLLLRSYVRLSAAWSVIIPVTVQQKAGWINWLA